MTNLERAIVLLEGKMRKLEDAPIKDIWHFIAHYALDKYKEQPKDKNDGPLMDHPV